MQNDNVKFKIYKSIPPEAGYKNFTL